MKTTRKPTWKQTAEAFERQRDRFQKQARSLSAVLRLAEAERDRERARNLALQKWCDAHAHGAIRKELEATRIALGIAHQKSEADAQAIAHLNSVLTETRKQNAVFGNFNATLYHTVVQQAIWIADRLPSAPEAVAVGTPGVVGCVAQPRTRE